MENKRNSIVVNGIKILLTASTVTGSIGLWSMFSLRSVQAANQKVAEQNSNTSAGTVIQQTGSSPLVQSSGVDPSLRKVNINFTKNSVPNQSPVQTIIVNSGSSGAPLPLTNTRSS
jgi:hypothetical protein